MIEVVVPAYNAGRFIRETLESVAAQTVLPAVVTVVDDASTDDTRTVVAAAAAELPVAIRLIANAGPRGPSAARNTAIRQSTADYIALLDADDLLAPNHHETLLRVVQCAEDVVLGFGDSTVFSGTETLVPGYLAVSGVAGLPATEIAPGCFTLADGIFAPLLRNGVFGTSACLFRRREAVDVGLFDESMMHGEDTDFFLRLALAGRFAFSRDGVMHKRAHNDNLSHQRNKLAFCRGTARSLAKLSARAAPSLSATQRAALRVALAEALDGYVYNASLAGLEAYRQAAALAREAGQAGIAARPRHVARLVLHGLRKPAG